MDFHVPELGEGVYEAELVAWHVKPGDAVKRGQSLAEVITDKASMDLPSPFAGIVDELRAEPGQQFKIGEVLLTYRGGGKEQNGEEETLRQGDKETRKQGDQEMVQGGDGAVVASPRPRVAVSVATTIRAAPSVRQLARELGVDLGHIRGSGPAGRILAADLAAAVRKQDPLELLPAADSRKPRADRKPIADLGKPGTRIKLAGLRRKIAEHLVHAKHTAPHFSLIDECDVTDLVRLREQLKEPLTDEGVKLTYLPFFVKALVAALKEVPIANASLDDAAGEIVLHDRYHIGIATTTAAGLIVPVVHDADKKDLTTLAREIERLSEDARNGRVKLEDLRGGTFTITSIGGIGGLISTPILNHPEVGILGLGRIVKRPVYDGAGNLRPAETIYLSFTFDHRVVDGAVAAIFANAVMRRLLQPAAMLL